MLSKTTLVIGATGKTSRRVAERLKARHLPVRIGSRSGQPPFDWSDPATWPPAVRDVAAVYVTYYPDLAAPGASDAIRAFTVLAVQSGVQRLVLLSGRGEPEAQRCEHIVRESGVAYTLLRASWFAQNFSEGVFLEPILAGDVALRLGTLASRLSTPTTLRMRRSPRTDMSGSSTS
jgi:uncharacterized protein YbjT (DUF2867 family)